MQGKPVVCVVIRVSRDEGRTIILGPQIENRSYLEVSSIRILVGET